MSRSTAQEECSFTVGNLPVPTLWHARVCARIASKQMFMLVVQTCKHHLACYESEQPNAGTVERKTNSIFSVLASQQKKQRIHQPRCVVIFD